MTSSYQHSAFPSSRDVAQPLLDLQRELSRMFDEAVRHSLSWSMTAAQEATQQASLAFTPFPRVDVKEDNNELCVTVELPGISSSDVEVRVEGDNLVISGERRVGKERQRQRFERTVGLPFAPDSENAEATHENGVLTVRLAKESWQRSRRIEVQTSDRNRSEAQGNAGHASNPSNQHNAERERSASSDGHQPGAVQSAGNLSRPSTSPTGGSATPQKTPGELPRKQPQPA